MNKNLPSIAFFLLVSTFHCLYLNAQETYYLHQEWLAALNKTELSPTLYEDNCGLLINDVLVIGKEAVIERWHQFKREKKAEISYVLFDNFQIRKEQKFELGAYTVGDYVYIAIKGWRKKGKWYKEFEAIYPQEKAIKKERKQYKLLNKANRKWEKYSNAHNVEGLVNN
ncbi:MAG: hypothetical protein AAFO07_15225, partial [Bacteroidota bacterium]